MKHLIFHIIVSDSAKILSSLSADSSIIVSGDQQTLNCTFEGNPSPSVRWIHNQTVVQDSESSVANTFALLDVTFTGISTAGEYTCEVNNSVGADQSSIFIIVQGDDHCPQYQCI